MEYQQIYCPMLNRDIDPVYCSEAVAVVDELLKPTAIEDDLSQYNTHTCIICDCRKAD